ncbi:hypothetical protein [Rhodococcus opacus]|uniref:hypothetical protein n=1 Tax=Rhodococcus opacus TaxID=37919 RepID=UPI000A61F0B8|nr:hypothetical protein [Rhodococcus opacus]
MNPLDRHEVDAIVEEGPQRTHAQSDFLKNLAVAGSLAATLAFAVRPTRSGS